MEHRRKKFLSPGFWRAFSGKEMAKEMGGIWAEQDVRKLI